eukprot:5232773-Pyramimonas_sp.AAC.1
MNSVTSKQNNKRGARMAGAVLQEAALVAQGAVESCLGLRVRVIGCCFIIAKNCEKHRAP